MTRRHCLPLVWAFLCVSSWIALTGLTHPPLAAPALQDPSRSVRDGVFSAAQASRGESVYAEECARCHAPNLSGGESSPALTGQPFLQVYEGLTVHDLFERIRSSMPQESPGRLTRQQYLDIVVFLLSKNGFAAGDADLSTDDAALKQIRIDPPKPR